MAIDHADKDLIDRALAGEQQAYAQILAKYQDMVFSVARQLMGTEEDAEDLAQESFVKAFRSLSKFEQRSKFSTWLYTIVYNTGLSKLRKKKLQLDPIDNDEQGVQVQDDNFLDGFGTIRSEQRTHYINLCLEELQEIDRTIITLFYFEDQSLQEIAEIVEMTENTVKVKLHRARKRLEKKLTVRLKDELKDLA